MSRLKRRRFGHGHDRRVRPGDQRREVLHGEGRDKGDQKHSKILKYGNEAGVGSQIPGRGNDAAGSARYRAKKAGRRIDPGPAPEQEPVADAEKRGDEHEQRHGGKARADDAKHVGRKAKAKGYAHERLGNGVHGTGNAPRPACRKGHQQPGEKGAQEPRDRNADAGKGKSGRSRDQADQDTLPQSTAVVARPQPEGPADLSGGFPAGRRQ